MTGLTGMHTPAVVCKFCAHNQGVVNPATVLAPQYAGGDIPTGPLDQDIQWVAACAFHFEGWWVDSIDDGEPIFPAVPISAAFLPKPPQGSVGDG